MAEFLFAMLVVSIVLMLAAGGAVFAWAAEESNSKAEWRINRHWIWKGALAGFFWPAGVVWIGRKLWKDYWANLPEK